MAFTTEFFWPFEKEHSEWWTLSCSLYTLLCVCCHSFLGSLSLLPSVITWRTWQAHFKGSKILPLYQESSESKSPVIFAESNFALCPKAEVSESSYVTEVSWQSGHEGQGSFSACFLFSQIPTKFSISFRWPWNPTEWKWSSTKLTGFSCLETSCWVSLSLKYGNLFSTTCIFQLT